MGFEGSQHILFSGTPCLPLALGYAPRNAKLIFGPPRPHGRVFFHHQTAGPSSSHIDRENRGPAADILGVFTVSLLNSVRFLTGNNAQNGQRLGNGDIIPSPTDHVPITEEVSVCPMKKHL